MLGLSSKPVLIAATLEQISEARVRLARIGIEDVAGCLDGGVEGWRVVGLPVGSLEQVSVQELAARLGNGGMEVLDVRREGEFQAGHIDVRIGIRWTDSRRCCRRCGAIRRWRYTAQAAIVA